MHCVLHVQDAHKNYTRTAKELNKVRASYGELEGMVSKLRSSLETTASSQGKDRNRIQDLSEEVLWFLFVHLLAMHENVFCTCTRNNNKKQQQKGSVLMSNPGSVSL